VDNFVDNSPLDTAQACNDAGFNKMPVLEAEFGAFKINDLQSQPSTR
jgi:hypothetical protein